LSDCGRCHLFPCNRTTRCPDGTYYKYRDGKLVEFVKLPPGVEEAFTKAILKIFE